MRKEVKDYILGKLKERFPNVSEEVLLNSETIKTLNHSIEYEYAVLNKTSMLNTFTDDILFSVEEELSLYR